MLFMGRGYSQIVILKSNPSNAYAALLASPYPTTTGPNPTDICGAAWTGGGSTGGWRTFFKLNDSALAGIIIDSAILQLWADPTSGLGFTGTPTYGTNNTSVLYRVTAPWATTINWLTMPSYTSTDSVILPLSTSTTENYLHINVTNLLNDIVASGNNYGFMFKCRQETSAYNSMIFYSSSAADSTKRPQILIYGHHNDNLFFTGGDTQSFTICVNETVVSFPINTFLSFNDSVAGVGDTLSLLSPPSHGTALVSYNATATGGIITPSGLTYTPIGGYTGTDVFKVRVSDGFSADTTTITVTINPYPNAGTISGIDSVCPGQTVTLSESVSTGFWSTSSFTISEISSSGVAKGLIPGKDTIVYTVENSCGISSAVFPFKVRSYAACHTGINSIPVGNNGIDIYPNPVNNTLNISTSEGIESITITNLLGQSIYKNEFNTRKAAVDVSNFPSGIYMIRVNGTEVRKFIME